jgi:hypothetical protein
MLERTIRLSPDARVFERTFQEAEEGGMRPLRRMLPGRGAARAIMGNSGTAPQCGWVLSFRIKVVSRAANLVVVGVVRRFPF